MFFDSKDYKKFDAFFYFELSKAEELQKQPVLLRVGKYSVSRSNQALEDLAELVFELTRKSMIQHIMKETGFTDCQLVGQFELSPEGEELYEEGGFPISFWYADTKYGRPWIVISQADTADEFFKIVMEDDDMRNMEPVYPDASQKITAVLYTEQNFALCYEAIEKEALLFMEGKK